MVRVLPHKLQIHKFEDLFCGLNPPCDDLDLLDLPSVVDKTLSYKENLGALREEYPQYTWKKGEVTRARSYEKQIVDDARAQVDEFSYDVIKKGKLANLQRSEGRSKRLQKKLEICEERPTRRPSIPGTCKIPTVKVRSYKRCPPRSRK